MKSAFKVKNTKYLETCHGIAYKSDIYLNDIRVAEGENEGDGGADFIFFFNHEIKRQYMEEAEMFFPDDPEPHSSLYQMLLDEEIEHECYGY